MRSRLGPAAAALVMAGVVLSGCAAGGQRAGSSAMATPIPGAAPVSCVNLQNIRESKVIDDRTIDFVMRDGRILRNTLPYSCPGLGFERAFSYKTSISQLCSVDIITVINNGAGIRTGASCGLGTFVPVTPTAK